VFVTQVQVKLSRTAQPYAAIYRIAELDTGTSRCDILIEAGIAAAFLDDAGVDCTKTVDLFV